jgi:diacylglycerol kinase family enzyme
MADETLTVIVNPSAGAARARAADRVTAAFSALGAGARIRVIPPEGVPAIAGEAAREGRVVGVAGGDGTLSAAAPAIAEAGGVLAPIPLGTRNHFARRLGIATIEDAVRALAVGRIARVPLGSVNGRVFINHASAGLYPRIVHHRERIRRWTGKPVAQILAGAYAVLRLRSMRLTLRVDGETLERTVPGLWVGLGRGAFRLPVDGHAPRGRNLELIVPETRSRAGLVVAGVQLLRRLRRGEHPELGNVEVIHASAFTLEADHAVDISRDGEVEREVTPIAFHMRPAALRVLSLAHADGGRAAA